MNIATCISFNKNLIKMKDTRMIEVKDNVKTLQRFKHNPTM